MAGERLDIRLDKERRKKLLSLAKREGVSISELVRSLIDREYETAERESRRAAALRIGTMEIEEVPDPETLSRELDQTYGSSLP
jgi:hypothetical protein